MTVHLEPVGADKMLLVEHCVVGAEEVKILELKNNQNVKKKNSLKQIL